MSFFFSYKLFKQHKQDWNLRQKIIDSVDYSGDLNVLNDEFSSDASLFKKTSVKFNGRVFSDNPIPYATTIQKARLSYLYLKQRAIQELSGSTDPKKSFPFAWTKGIFLTSEEHELVAKFAEAGRSSVDTVLKHTSTEQEVAEYLDHLKEDKNVAIQEAHLGGFSFRPQWDWAKPNYFWKQKNQTTWGLKDSSSSASASSSSSSSQNPGGQDNNGVYCFIENAPEHYEPNGDGDRFQLHFGTDNIKLTPEMYIQPYSSVRAFGIFTLFSFTYVLQAMFRFRQANGSQSQIIPLPLTYKDFIEFRSLPIDEPMFAFGDVARLQYNDGSSKLILTPPAEKDRAHEFVLTRQTEEQVTKALWWKGFRNLAGSIALGGIGVLTGGIAISQFT